MMSPDQFLQIVSIAAIPILFAITLHEAAHAYTAWHFGDLTAEKLGRISFNPIRHIDPFGTILLPLLTFWAFNLPFGWAKPVPVNFANLRHPKQDMFWVSLAGPASNLLMALLWGLFYKLALIFSDNYFAAPLLQMARIGIFINAIMVVLNMLPIPPLDGGRVMVSVLPTPWAMQLARIEPYGMFILIALALTGVLGALLFPLVSGLSQLILILFGM